QNAPANDLTGARPLTIPSIVLGTPEEASKTPTPRRRFSFVRFLILLFVGLGLFGSGMAIWGYREFERDLPERWSALTDYKPSRASRVFSSEGELIGEFFLQ